MKLTKKSQKQQKAILGKIKRGLPVAGLLTGMVAACGCSESVQVVGIEPMVIGKEPKPVERTVGIEPKPVERTSGMMLPEPQGKRPADKTQTNSQIDFTVGEIPESGTCSNPVPASKTGKGRVIHPVGIPCLPEARKPAMTNMPPSAPKQPKPANPPQKHQPADKQTK